ncbi:hypothetical protein [Streptomyces sp. NPDC051109]
MFRTEESFFNGSRTFTVPSFVPSSARWVYSANSWCARLIGHVKTPPRKD